MWRLIRQDVNNRILQLEIVLVERNFTYKYTYFLNRRYEITYSF